MKAAWIIIIFIVCATCISFSFKDNNEYKNLYLIFINDFNSQQLVLLNSISSADITSAADLENIRQQIKLARLKLKGVDFWLRYLEPIVYKKINGPLPVEWETEVFEKFEKPYKRDGAGLSLAEVYLDEKSINKDTLRRLISSSINATKAFFADSILQQLNSPDHFFLANRLFLLNLSAIYTTGFECPDNTNIVPELRVMLNDVREIYKSFDDKFPAAVLTPEYLALYDKALKFVNHQNDNYTLFDHFAFIKDYVNPLFALNQKMIVSYSVISKSFNDYALNDNCNSIFDKSLYNAQNTKGIYSLVDDEGILGEIKQTGKLLFYDPVLSSNNKRSCASCHKPTEYFTDTAVRTGMQFDQKQRLLRNTPSLINATFNHLLMLDGKHISLQDQLKDVMANHQEMNCGENEVVEKVLSCKEYKEAFKKFLKFTPEEKHVTIDHIISAITYYYADFSNYYSPFDDAMNNNSNISEACKKGFNLFMSKAQCATCHFVPQFNGVKPPYIGSEFEVLGVPEDIKYARLSADSGRYALNQASEMVNAFRTGSIRNAQYTAPYMHNGVFKTLNEVVDFYDGGGGAGHKLNIVNQTLSADSLELSQEEKNELLMFMSSLNERIIFQTPPEKLPASSKKILNLRKVGGEY